MKKKNIIILLVLLVTALLFCQAAEVFGEDSQNSELPKNDLSELKLSVSAGEKELSITAVSGLMDMDTDLWQDMVTELTQATRVTSTALRPIRQQVIQLLLRL